jgi:hypothetical protein
MLERRNEMPNWCDNAVYITHDDPKKIQILVDAWKASKFFGTIYPEPDYTKVEVRPTFPSIKGNNDPVNPESAWWDWRVQNWGTKWEVASDDTSITHFGDNKIGMCFSTAWSPPTGIFDKLVEQGYGVFALYYEGGCAFCGQYVDGSDETYGIDGDWKWVQENIPEEIDSEFAISMSMKEYRADDLASEIEELEETLKEEHDEELSAQLIAKKQELEEIENA